MQFCPSGIWDSDHTKTPLGLEMLLINEQGGLTPICHTWFLVPYTDSPTSTGLRAKLCTVLLSQM
ncbi:unnamed protein product [Brassica oleracea]